jgi:N-acetylglutamate synthase-like GNAT family acetyltransferase
MANREFEIGTEFRDFDIESRDELDRLAAWSTHSDDMLPLSTESVARHHLSTGAYLAGELAGYAAISVIYSKEVIEFGGLVVNPNMRRHHIGSKLVTEVVTKAREEIDPRLILAFGNDNSARVFQKLGASQIDDISELPPEVWKLCHICPRLEIARTAGKSCCDRVFDLTSVVLDMAQGE